MARSMALALASFRVELATETIARRAGDMIADIASATTGSDSAAITSLQPPACRALELATLDVRQFPVFERLQPPLRSRRGNAWGRDTVAAHVAPG